MDRAQMIKELAGTDSNVRAWLESLTDAKLEEEYQVMIIDKVVEKVFSDHYSDGIQE